MKKKTRNRATCPTRASIRRRFGKAMRPQEFRPSYARAAGACSRGLFAQASSLARASRGAVVFHGNRASAWCVVVMAFGGES